MVQPPRWQLTLNATLEAIGAWSIAVALELLSATELTRYWILAESEIGVGNARMTPLHIGQQKLQSCEGRC